MKLLPVLVVLLVSGSCFAGTTTHHWFSKVPVNQATAHGKKGVKYKKGYNQKVKAAKGKTGRGRNGKRQSAILTRVTSK
jgi:hypothetical protein